MTTISEALQAAIEFHQEGDLGQAEQLYRQILQIVPNHAETLHLLGILASQVNQSDVAIDLISQAIALQPSTPYFHYNLALALEENGEREAAITSLQSALSLDPAYPRAYFHLGLFQQQSGQLEACIRSFHRAIELQPDEAVAHFRMGVAFDDLRNMEAAIGSYQEAIRLRPSYVEALNNLGNVYKSQGLSEKAIEVYRQALSLNENQPDIHLNLGNVYYSESIFGSAEIEYRKSIALRPDHADVHKLLGDVLHETGRPEEAIESYRTALHVAPQNAAVLLAVINAEQHICHWEKLDDLTSKLLTLLEKDNFTNKKVMIAPLGIASLPIATAPSLQRRSCEAWARQCSSATGNDQRPFSGKQRSDRNKIRIGYLSGDYRTHPVGYLVADLFESHDRTHFDIYGYSFGLNDGSEIRQRIEKSFDVFRDIRTHSFQAAAEKIENDEIDILVDLQGYTQNCRTEILTFRPAPIQVNYLGYAGTMGADFIDYNLVDEFVVPSEHQSNFTEKLAYLPGCFMVNDRHREIALRTPSREEAGLPADGFVLCSFNTSIKIKRPMFQCWLRLLKRIPGSVLWLRETNVLATTNLRREANSFGIKSDRIVFAPRVSMPEHLARQRLADLFLDTFPYNHHSTASDALRMGVPMITLCGDMVVSRVAGSLLKALGRSELICTRLDEYEALALDFMEKPERLAEIRRQLDETLKTSTLYDGSVFAKGIENIYRSIWERYRRGDPPQTIYST
ncbi:MAG: tetratricopeptide repeat protein [Pirellulaceae bacterium]|nr:tetratricopeptide repeat protein [Pirellulaceae bacterium]